MKPIGKACVLFAVLFLLTGVSAQEKLGTLRIAVLDPSGAVIPGAKIRIIGSAEADKTGFTDGHGHFVTELVPGDYDVFVSFQVFSPAAKKLRLKAGKATDYSVRLKFDRLTKFVEVQ